MARLRVLFVNENIGGHATVHHHLRAAFADHRGVDATFVDVPAPGVLRRLAGARVPGLAHFDIDLQPLRAQLAASAWVRREVAPSMGSYDVVHLYTQNAGLLSAAALSSARTVVNLDTTNVLNATRLPYRTPGVGTPLTIKLTVPFESRVYRSADALIASSEFCRRSLVDDYGLADDAVDVLPMGVAGPPTLPERSHTGRPTVVFVGRQFDRKGGPHLIEAFGRIRERAELVLVTTDSVPTMPGVRVIDDLAPGDPRLWQILADADVFAFPSTIDQAPNAVLEAMASGLAVVTTDCGAMPEMVVHGETGLIHRGGDVDSLAVALETLVDDVALRSSMGALGRRRFTERYEVSAAAGRLVDVFERVADRGRQGASA